MANDHVPEPINQNTGRLDDEERLPSHVGQGPCLDSGEKIEG